MAKKEELKTVHEVRQQESIIYIGPTIPNRIAKYALFCGGRPKIIGELKEVTGIEHLFVDVSDLNAAKEKLKDKTNYLSVIYDAVDKKWGEK